MLVTSEMYAMIDQLGMLMTSDSIYDYEVYPRTAGLGGQREVWPHQTAESTILREHWNCDQLNYRSASREVEMMWLPLLSDVF